MNTGLQLTLSQTKFHPVQLLVLIVFSPAFHGERERERELPAGSGLQLPAGVKRSSWERLFIPVLRENQAPKPGGGTLGLRGL